MPLAYRVMKTDGNAPLVGESFVCLGVRPGKDIQSDAQSTVAPNTGGLSVDESFSSINKLVLPRSLRNEVRRKYGNTVPKEILDFVYSATGPASACIWKIGDGPFENSMNFANGLSLRLVSYTHGFVEPRSAMPIANYQQHLAATRHDWRIDTEHRLLLGLSND